MGTNDYTVEFIPTSEAPSRAKQIVRPDDIIVSLTRPHRGAIAKIKADHNEYIASTGFAVLHNLKSNRINRDYLFNVLCSSTSLNQFLQRSSGGNYPAITSDELMKVRIPLPALPKQVLLVDRMEIARKDKDGRLVQADALLDDIDNYVLKTLALKQPKEPRKVFAIKGIQLTNALNTERYRGMQLEQQLPFSSKVSDVADILDSRCSPEKENADTEWDWIRIDDLPNHPWNVETIRTEYGCNIQGTFFEVSENDILIARLGPTIQNAKFVLCPPLKRRTVASPEFLVLRCHKGWNPETVLWILRTKIYRDIMYARSRGGTPSRYRLDAADLPQIPFPNLSNATQQAIAKEVCQRRAEAKRLRDEADADWSAAKKKFELELLGEPA